jgi:ClpP class serine protease
MNATTNHHRILAAIQSEIWAITPEALNQIIAIAQGANESPEAVAARLGRPLENTRTVTQRDGAAIIPVIGPIFRYANVFTEISGAASIQTLATDLNAALNNPNIKGIILEMDSPGGMVAGVSEFAAMVRNGTARKPITAYVSNIGASAAYWVAAAASEIVIADTAMLGSIGTVLRANLSTDKNTVDIVSSQSPNKRLDANTDAGRAQLQAQVDSLATVLVETVAKYRGVTPSKVLSDYGRGGLLVGANAVKAGLADRLGSLESIIKQFSSSNGESKPMPKPTHQTAAQPAPGPASLEDSIKAKWNSDPALRAEFADRFETYAAYARAEASGKVRIHGGGLTRYKGAP